MMKLVFCMFFHTLMLLSTFSLASRLEIGVRILFNEGRSIGLGNPCTLPEREMIKIAFRNAATGDKIASGTDRQLLSCSYLCEDYDTDVCYLAHPHCAGSRTFDETDRHPESNYLDPVGIQKFQGEHMIFEDICDVAFSSLEEKEKCNVQKTEIHKKIKDWLVPQLSGTCNRLVQNHVNMTCFRL